MDMTEKNGQPSMEEILASIRRIVAEEPEMQMPHASAGAPVIDFRNNPITLNGDGVLDDTSEFDLPAIFRSSATPAPEKPGPLIGRLTDAIRNATSAQVEPRHQPEPRQVQIVEESEPSGARFGGQSENYQALSSLKPARFESPAQEPAAPEQKPAGQGWSFARPASPSPAVNDEIKRVMSPFKDTHFLRMSGPAAEEPTSAAALPVAVTPAPVAPVVENPQAAVPATQIEASRAPDFGAIIPGHFERPASASEMERRPAAPQPGVYGQPLRPDVAAEREAVTSQAVPHESLTPPPLTLVASESADPAEAPPAALSDAQGTGSIEDTTAELLRPMLRLWLAENMPRMVEKALHIEVAESVRTGKKPTGL